MEVLVRTALFKSANALVGWLLQQAADRIDTAYQPSRASTTRGGSARRWRACLVRSPWSAIITTTGKKQGHYPADAALGLETGTPQP